MKSLCGEAIVVRVKIREGFEISILLRMRTYSIQSRSAIIYQPISSKMCELKHARQHQHKSSGAVCRF
jgi:hypothetical protein